MVTVLCITMSQVGREMCARKLDSSPDSSSFQVQLSIKFRSLIRLSVGSNHGKDRSAPSDKRKFHYTILPLIPETRNLLRFLKKSLHFEWHAEHDLLDLYSTLLMHYSVDTVFPFTTKLDNEIYYWLQNATRYAISTTWLRFLLHVIK